MGRSIGSASGLTASAAIQRLARLLRATLEGTETDLIGSPVVLGSGAFGLALVSPALGCHLFIASDQTAGSHTVRHAEAIVTRLRAAVTGWPAVTAWRVGAARGAERASKRADGLVRDWPEHALASPDAARHALVGAAPADRPSIAVRRRAMRALAVAFVDPLGAFDGFSERLQRDRGTGALREQLDVLDRWLSGRTLDSDQSAVVGLEIDGLFLDARGPAGSGKTTALARQAARSMERLQPAHASSESVPTVLATARTPSAAMQLRARLGGAFRRWTGGRGLPRWMDAMDLASAADRVKALRAGGAFEGYLRIFVDEAHELDATALRWLTTRALHPRDPRRGVMSCSDEGQRLSREPDAIGRAASDGGLVHRREELPIAYRAPRQVIEAAFNVLHGSFAGPRSDPSERAAERRALEQRLMVDRAEDGWLQVRFAGRGIGLEGGPAGEPVRCVRAASIRAASEAAVRDAIGLIDRHGAAAPDVVVVSVDPRASAAVVRAAADAGAAARFTRRAKDPSRPPQDRIRILNVAECRGHDFPIVLLVGIDRRPGTHEDRTLLYQAATRAQHLLVAYGVAGTGMTDEIAECALRSGMRD